MSPLAAVSLFVLLFSVVSSEFVNIGYRDCKSQFKINTVTADGCSLKEVEGKKICVFKENSRPIIRINFTPDEEVTSFKTTIKAKLGDTMLDFPIDNSDACKASGLSCPLKPGQQYTYEQAIDIGNNYPSHDKVQVNWVVDRQEPAGKDLCIIFLASISQ